MTASQQDSDDDFVVFYRGSDGVAYIRPEVPDEPEATEDDQSSHERTRPSKTLP